MQLRGLIENEVYEKVKSPAENKEGGELYLAAISSSRSGAYCGPITVVPLSAVIAN